MPWISALILVAGDRLGLATVCRSTYRERFLSQNTRSVKTREIVETLIPIGLSMFVSWEIDEQGQGPGVKAQHNSCAERKEAGLSSEASLMAAKRPWCEPLSRPLTRLFIAMIGWKDPVLACHRGDRARPRSVIFFHRVHSNFYSAIKNRPAKPTNSRLIRPRPIQYRGHRAHP